MSNPLIMLEFPHTSGSGGELMRMSKAMIDELVDTMLGIFEESSSIDSLAIEVRADGRLYILETPQDMSPVRYPRFSDIHGDTGDTIH